MDEKIQLSPAQIEFIKRTFPDFDGLNVFGELAGRAGSQRYFTRIRHEGRTCILVEWDSHDEDWERFLVLGRDREQTSYLLPRIYADDAKHGLILEEDLGAVTLKKRCAEIHYAIDSMVDLYQQVLDALLKWQHPSLKEHPAISERQMDLATFLWETGYFGRFCVNDYCGCEQLLDDAWERERTALAQECAALPQTAIHRDFQSENVLLYNGAIRFVDFQGARLGPPEYDVASLLFDPYIQALGGTLSDMLYRYYCNASQQRSCHTRPLLLCGIQRLMQALGAYGNLSLHKGKEWYQAYIPVALERLCMLLQQTDDFPHLYKVVENCRNVVACMNTTAPVSKKHLSDTTVSLE